MATVQGYPEEVPDDHGHVAGSWASHPDGTVPPAHGEQHHFGLRQYSGREVQDWLRQMERATSRRSVTTTTFVQKSAAMAVLAVSFLLLFGWLAPETLPTVGPTLGLVVLTNWVRLFWQWRH